MKKTLTWMFRWGLVIVSLLLLFHWWEWRGVFLGTFFYLTIVVTSYYQTSAIIASATVLSEKLEDIEYAILYPEQARKEYFDNDTEPEGRRRPER